LAKIPLYISFPSIYREESKEARVELVVALPVSPKRLERTVLVVSEFEFVLATLDSALYKSLL